MTEFTGLLPFVPSGADFVKSQELFRALGFEEQWSGGGCVGFRRGAARFILQDFNEAGFAQNFMVRIDVGDLDAWWAEVEPLGLEERFLGVKLRPPTNFPWGREVHFIDLAGVCWHVGAG